MENNFDDIFNQQSESEAGNDAVEQTQVEVTPEVTETVEEPTETADAEQATEQTEAAPHRDDKGRFAPKPEGEEQKQPEAIPLAALMEERKRWQAQLEAERLKAADHEKQLQALRQQQQSENLPDPFDNPKEYTAYLREEAIQIVRKELQDREVQAIDARVKASIAKADADPTIGTERRQQALDWASQVSNAGPQGEEWGRHALAQADPVAWIIEQQTRHAQQQEMLANPDEWALRRAAELSAAGAANNTIGSTTNATQMSAKVQAPKSLASLGNGSPVTKNAQPQGDSFNDIFK